MAYAVITPYADETYADAYFGERLNTDEWDAADSATKVKALKMATREIDHLPLVGSKCDSTQARQFPRDVDDCTAGIPAEVSNCCCEVAIELLRGKTSEELNDYLGVSAEQTGDASVTFSGERGDAALSDEFFGLPSQEAAQWIAEWVVDQSVIDVTRV